ncbi:MAG: c-type cytochrome [Acidobacteria bacterium]|nr:c-type cytochrome [Acidobacteriota bacterium]
MLPKISVFVLLLAALGGCSRAPKHLDQAPMTPQESLKAMQLSEDFKVEIFATEPHVVDPVDMAFDESGRIYVAEMLDYPDDPPPGKPVRSRVRVLEDKNGDGVIDASHIYADNLLQVSGLMCWKGGLIVGAAPDILYLKDADGDGKAEVLTVLYTGFPKVNPEGRITNFTLGIDNWIYAANNGADARLAKPGSKDEPLLLRGADLRFDPLTGVAERASGPAQFGLTMDDWGNRFITQNTVHLRQAVVPAEYLNRSQFLEVGAVSQDISPDGKGQTPMFPLTKPQQWRVQRTALRQDRYKETNPGRVEHLQGFFTAASGSIVYNGDAWPAKYYGSIFTGDVSANLVRRETLEPNGVTFLAKPAIDKTEFLASGDVWFRPAHFANAPDGNFYVLDMYREYIETPESIPEEIKKGLDFWSGDDKGRIYRIVSKTPAQTRGLKVDLGSKSSADLVAMLSNPNGWHRDTAHRLLLERQDKSVARALAAELTNAASPQARLHALWLLKGLGVLEASHVARALKDEHAALREHGVKLSEKFPALQTQVMAMASDSALRVRYQLAYTLGEFNTPAARTLLAKLITQHGDDRWFRVAVLTSAANQPAEFLSAVKNRDFVQQLAQLIGARRRTGEIEALLAKSGTDPSALNGLARGMKLSGGARVKSAAAEAAFRRVLASDNPAVQQAAWNAAQHFDMPAIFARALAEAEKGSVSAVRAIGSGVELAKSIPVLEKLLTGSPTPELQAAAIGALGDTGDSRAPGIILGAWKTLRGDARVRAVNTLAGRKDWATKLIDAVEKNQVEAAGVDIAARVRLIESGDARAKALFTSGTAERAKALAAYASVPSLNGNAAKGKLVFEENCARCHMPRRQGGRVGPDLSGVNNKTREELLKAILDPSAAIEPRFVNYMVTTKDGQVFDGLIANETPAAITLRGGTEDGDQTILRKNVAEARASSISLMPEELEKAIDKQAMADLIAYLRAGL